MLAGWPRLGWPRLGQLGQLGSVRGLSSSCRLSWASRHSDGRGARTSRVTRGILQPKLGTGTASLLPHSIWQSKSKGLPWSTGKETDATFLVRRTAFTWQRMRTGRREEWMQPTRLILFPLWGKHEFGIIKVFLSLCSLLFTFLFGYLKYYILCYLHSGQPVCTEPTTSGWRHCNWVILTGCCCAVLITVLKLFLPLPPRICMPAYLLHWDEASLIWSKNLCLILPWAFSAWQYLARCRCSRMFHLGLPWWLSG